MAFQSLSTQVISSITPCAKDLQLISQLAGRERKKNEALAAKVFGKGRRNSAPGAVASGGRGKPGPGQSLASRVGVQKVFYI